MLTLLILARLLVCSYSDYCWNSTNPCWSGSGPPPCGMNKQTGCTQMCPDGCQQQYQNTGCLNLTRSNPVRTIMGCASSRDNSCNINGNGTVCPLGCADNGSTCIPSPDNRSVCDNAIVWQCPLGCNYMKKSHTCQPATQYAVCGFIKKTLTCPAECTYNPQFVKCISSDPNIVCELSKNMRCPTGCSLNPRGDTCIGASICTARSDHIVCPPSCVWNPGQNLCMMSNPWSRVQPWTYPCEPIMTVYCPFPDSLTLSLRYVISPQYPYCAGSMLNDICFDNDNGIMYPLRLGLKYINVTACKYSPPYCNSIAQTCCYD